MNSSLLTWQDRHMKQFKDQSHNAQNIRSCETAGCIFKTIRMILYIMVVTIKKLQAWIWEKIIPVIMHIMRYPSGNMYYVVVINDPVWSCPVSI